MNLTVPYVKEDLLYCWLFETLFIVYRFDIANNIKGEKDV